MWSRTLALILTGVALVAAPAEGAGPSGDHPADSRRELLGGRLTLEVQGGGEVRPRGGALMGAPPSDLDESRVVIDRGAERFVLLAAETYQRVGSEWPPASTLAAQAKRVWPGPLETKPFQMPQGLRALRLSPAKEACSRVCEWKSQPLRLLPLKLIPWVRSERPLFL